jgi:hypothetical protein
MNPTGTAMVPRPSALAGPGLRFSSFALWLVFMLLGACAAPPAVPESGDANRLLIVDCLMPGQVRKLGAFATGVSPRHPEKVAAYECEAAGGEYALAGTNPKGALNIWLPFAQQGDSEAQTQAGELYERGIGALPDYASAAKWYQLAADQGYSRAVVNLGSLYERGLGVPHDPARAAALFRQASGFHDDTTPAPAIHIINPLVVLPAVGVRGAAPAVPVKAQRGSFFEVAGQATAEGGLQSVLVNDHAVKVDAQGMFHADVDLSSGSAGVRIAATDRRGRQTVVALTLVSGNSTTGAKEPWLSVGNAAQFGDYYALIIANQNYRSFERLDTPFQDARDLRTVLQRRFGFKVTELNDATRRDVFATLNNLRSKLTPRDNLLVFYAGHGEIDSVTQRGYWVPVDGEPKNRANWVSVVDVTDQLNAISAKQVLVVADSCYSGTMTRAALPQAEAALAEDARLAAIRNFSRVRARVALTSGGLEPVVDGGAGRNSIFVKSLIEVLGAVREPIEARRLYGELTARFLVRAQRLHVQQRPDYAPIKFAGHEAGDFLFVPVK